MKITFRFPVGWLLIVLVVTACSPTTPASREVKGAISISGAFALYPMMTRWAEEFQHIHPGVQFDISAGGAGKGMADVLSGAVDIGMVSREVTSDEENQGAYWVAVTKDAVFATINAENPVADQLLAQGVTRETFTKIFVTGEITTWGEVVGRPEITDAIHVYTRSDACGAAETWAGYLGARQADLIGTGIYGDPGLLDAVANDPLGIGYNNLGYAFDLLEGEPATGTIVLPLDLNGNGLTGPDESLGSRDEALASIASGRYPSPPARELNLVTLGKPSGLVQAFVEWILTEGQRYVSNAGFIQLTAEQLEAGLLKIR